MLIQSVAPYLVADISLLGARLTAHWRASGLPEEEAEALLSLVPLQFQLIPCFLDRLTDLWRYEYGMPYMKDDLVLYGPHVWPEVAHLARTLRSAIERLAAPDRDAYLVRLVNVDLHASTLVEFQPIVRLGGRVGLAYEAPTGIGASTADWCLTPHDASPVLVEVKKRSRDIIELSARVQAGERAPDGTSPVPDHDPALLFRSVEEKYPSRDPDVRLQGVWIHTALAQDTAALNAAFDKLDHTRVHFAVLGSWERGILPLVRRDADRERLISLFREEISQRYDSLRQHI